MHFFRFSFENDDLDLRLLLQNTHRNDKGLGER